MTGASEASPPAPALPWSARVFASAPLSPLVPGLLVALCYVSAWLAAGAFLHPGAREGLAGRPLWGEDSWSEAVLRGLMLGYLPVLVVWSRSAALRALDGLAPTLQGGEASRVALASTLAPSRGALRAAGVVGALVLPAFGAVFFPAGGEGCVRAARTIWNTLHFMLAGWLTVRAVVHDIHVAQVFSRIGAGAVALDLLDLAPLRPITRWALRAVLLWVIYFTLVSLFVVGPGPANPANLTGIVPLLVVAFAALLLPVRGLQERIRAGKRSELAWLDAEIRRERDALLRGAGAAESPRLANLSAYRSLVADVRELPYDATSLLRFALYLAVGLGSWLGGALVERILDRVLG
jgi:hypothetical protein